MVADGGTDRALIPLLEWAIHRLDPAVEILEPEFRKRQGSVKDFLASYSTSAMIVFVHRDAETAALDERLVEFTGVVRNDVVPVVPVRMTEAWLLVDGPAIAAAAGRPSAVVSLPSIAQLEGLADPKDELEARLLAAAGPLTGRRLKKFRSSLDDRRINVASRIADFGALEHVPAFARFQVALAAKYPYSL